jgi:hypothetical protein
MFASNNYWFMNVWEKNYGTTIFGESILGENNFWFKHICYEELLMQIILNEKKCYSKNTSMKSIVDENIL